MARGPAGAAAEVVTAVAAVLPPGVADADPRRAAVAHLVGSEPELQAAFRGTPY